MDETQIAETLTKSVANIREMFASFSVEDLEALKAAEEAADNKRVTLVQAIDDEIAERQAPAARSADDVEGEIAELEGGVIDMAKATRLRLLRAELAELK